MKMKSAFVFAVMMLCMLTACGGSGNSTGDAAAGTQPENVQAENDPAPEEPAQEAPSDGETAGNGLWEITYQRARAYTDSSGAAMAQVIVEITNTSDKNLYLNSSFYDLEDADGNALADMGLASVRPLVLAPGEKGYMYDERPLDGYSGGEGDLTLLPNPAVAENAAGPIRYGVSEVSVSGNSDGGITVTGQIENTTEETPSMAINVVAFFYDADGTLLGSAADGLSELFEPGTKIDFAISSYALPGDVTAEAIADTVVYAYPFQPQE